MNNEFPTIAKIKLRGRWRA